MLKTPCYLDGKLASLCGTGYNYDRDLKLRGYFFLFISNHMIVKSQRKNLKIPKIRTTLMYTLDETKMKATLHLAQYI